MPEQQKIDFKPKVLEHVQRNGPCLPVQISKIIEREIYVSSAVLSELVSSKRVLVSAAKFGGSPVYYVPGQEYKLQTMLYPHLKDKEKEAFDLIKRNLVLRDRSQEPAIRVALRNLRDFAVQIEVKEANQSDLYWKWYILPDEEAKSRIIKMMSSFPKSQEAPKPEIKPEIKLEIKQEIKPVAPIKEEIKEEVPEVKEGFFKKIKSKIIRKSKTKDLFEECLYEYLQKNNIKVVSSEIVKKNKEINMVVKLPSVVGDLTMFLKAINKSKVSNTDLLMASNEAQQKHLNTLLLTTGDPGKKAEEFIEKKLNGRLVLRQIK
ncbi:hypothetical protein J4427_01585 [Candidatus Woesearchaeota archaeon]|nr:hypothetical protein [Candidatus Woesearchaeota archaeon]